MNHATAKLEDLEQTMRRERKRAVLARESKTPCAHCGGTIGPDITGRPMCYGCGPIDMVPRSVFSDDERWLRFHLERSASARLTR